MNDCPYPWLAATWHTLVEGLRGGHLGHAYLLSGREGLGKTAFARAFTRVALCEQPGDAADTACGQCRGCTLLETGAHADFHEVTIEPDHSGIGVDQIRALIEFFTLKGHFQSRKIALIHPAEAMNTASANALLKILEEPPAGALLLLVSHRPGRLPATVRSRCQKLRVPTPPWKETLQWLGDRAGAAGERMLSGAPLTVYAELEESGTGTLDAVLDLLLAVMNGERSMTDASRLVGEAAPGALIDATDTLVCAALQMANGHPPSNLQVAAARAGDLQSITDNLNSRCLFEFLDALAESRVILQRSSGVRGMEVFENVINRWARFGVNA